MSLEDRLRTTLTDDRRALPGWPGPADRIVAGIRRRRRRRAGALTAAAALVVAAAVGVPVLLQKAGPSGPNAQTGGQQPVAWLAEPAPEPTNIATRSPRPDARGCTASDLGRRAWSEESGTPGTVQVLVANQSDSRCTLDGSAALTGIEAGSGRKVDLMLQPASAHVTGAQHPATVDPGEPARLALTPSTTCAGEGERLARYRQLSLRVLGREIPVEGLELSTCVTVVGDWYVLPPALNARSQLATIESPARVRRGTTLEYVVTILNPSDQPFRLDPCPVYRQRLANSATTYRFNCVRDEISPHRSLRFSMRLEVPSTAPLGETRLTWRAVMSDGRVAVANLDDGGVPITIER